MEMQSIDLEGDDDDNMEVFASYNGENIVMIVHKTATVADLKMELSKTRNIKYENYSIQLGDTVLNDNDSLDKFDLTVATLTVQMMSPLVSIV